MFSNVKHVNLASFFMLYVSSVGLSIGLRLPEEGFQSAREEIQLLKSQLSACAQAAGGEPGGESCIWTKFQPAFQICLHDVAEDIYISKGLKETGHFDLHIEKTIQLLSRHVRHDQVFVDIGGNIGTFSLYAAALGYRVYTFEPYVRNYQKLLAAKELNNFPNMKLYSSAVSDSCSAIDLYAYKSNLGSVFVPAENDVRLQDKGVQYVGSSISVKLDDLLRDVGEITLMKMDCEGHEAHALEGMKNLLLQKRIRTVLMEIQPLNYDSHIMEDIASYGYSFFEISVSKVGTYTRLDNETLIARMSHKTPGFAFEVALTLNPEMFN